MLYFSISAILFRTLTSACWWLVISVGNPLTATRIFNGHIRLLKKLFQCKNKNYFWNQPSAFLFAGCCSEDDSFSELEVSGTARGGTDGVVLVGGWLKIIPASSLTCSGSERGDCSCLANCSMKTPCSLSLSCLKCGSCWVNPDPGWLTDIPSRSWAASNCSCPENFFGLGSSVFLCLFELAGNWDQFQKRFSTKLITLQLYLLFL